MPSSNSGRPKTALALASDPLQIHIREYRLCSRSDRNIGRVRYRKRVEFHVSAPETRRRPKSEGWRGTVQRGVAARVSAGASAAFASRGLAALISFINQGRDTARKADLSMNVTVSPKPHRKCHVHHTICFVARQLTYSQQNSKRPPGLSHTLPHGAARRDPHLSRRDINISTTPHGGAASAG